LTIIHKGLTTAAFGLTLQVKKNSVLQDCGSKKGGGKFEFAMRACARQSAGIFFTDSRRIANLAGKLSQ